MLDVQSPLDAQVSLKLQNILMLLKRCCNHPYLVEYPLDPATGEFKVTLPVLSVLQLNRISSMKKRLVLG